MAVDLKLFPDLDGIVHVDQALGIGHHSLVFAVIGLIDLARLDRTGFQRSLGEIAHGAHIDVVLFLDIGVLIPDVPDIDDFIRRDLACVIRGHRLLQRLEAAGDGLRPVRLVLQQRAARSEIELIVIRFGIVPDILNPDGLLRQKLAALEQRENLMQRVERIDVVTLIGQIVGAEDHILRRHGDGLAVLRAEQVIRREHQHTGFRLRLRRQRDMDCHLVAVEVRVERRAAQGMQLDGATLDQHRLKRLNAETVQRRRTVQHDGTILDDVFQRVPDLRLALIDLLLGALDVVGDAVLDKLLHHKGTKQLDCHFLRHAALIELQLRTDDDNGTAGIVNALAEQVLTETPLLALEHIGQGLKRTVVRARDGSAAATVINERVHRLLQHTLFVTDDDIRCVELYEAL